MFKNRLLFSKGEQSRFISDCSEAIRLTDRQLSDLLKISKRTLSNWKKEKYNISVFASEILSSKAKVSIPSNTKVLSSDWFAKKAAKLGGEATYKKYGKVCLNENERKIAWQKWWQSGGKNNKNLPTCPKKIYFPKKSVKLSEFIGILIGDGGISEYQITITLNKETDCEYVVYICQLIENLFKMRPSRNMRQSVVNIQVSRKELTKYLITLGLKIGNKIRQQIDIPSWIKQNNKYSLACVRGLVDTDGCFYFHRYKRNEKSYSYPRIAFVSRSKPLINSVKIIMEREGIHTRVDSRGDLRIYSLDDVRNYYQKFGSHNQKHINKFITTFGKVA